MFSTGIVLLVVGFFGAVAEQLAAMARNLPRDFFFKFIYPFNRLPRFHDRAKVYGMYSEFDIFKYRPNPFWSAEENYRHRHLGNLERFGTWHPPGPHKVGFEGWQMESPRFQYTDRPMPRDHLNSLLGYKYEKDNTWGFNIILYGFDWGFGVAIPIAIVIVLCKKYLFTKSDEEADEEHH